MKIGFCLILVIIILLIFSSQNKVSCRKSKDNKIKEGMSYGRWEPNNSINCLRNI
jgi:hypothetical protein